MSTHLLLKYMASNKVQLVPVEPTPTTSCMRITEMVLIIVVLVAGPKYCLTRPYHLLQIVIQTQWILIQHLKYQRTPHTLYTFIQQPELDIQMVQALLIQQLLLLMIFYIFMRVVVQVYKCIHLQVVLPTYNHIHPGFGTEKYVIDIKSV